MNLLLDNDIIDEFSNLIWSKLASKLDWDFGGLLYSKIKYDLSNKLHFSLQPNLNDQLESDIKGLNG